jgi:PAS domain S-box-containing protein
MMSAVWDVTERWRTEEALRSANRALRQSADEYRELFEAESDAILLIDNESGRLLQANHAACALYGYSREELLSMRNVDLSAEPEHTRDVTRHTPPVASRVVSIPLRRHRRKDGTIVPVDITGRFFVKDGRAVHIAAIRDITERVRAEARMAEQLEELRRWHDATLGREGRILELKREVNALLADIGQSPRYPSATEEPLVDG